MSAEIITIVASATGIVISMGGLIIALFLNANAELKEFRKEWAQESKDFHGRLIAIETDFKTFMKDQERERTKVILGK